MSVVPFDALTCPLDGQPLSHEAGVWRCPDGHSFDAAKQGHIHLLPVQHKRSRDPGDSKPMVQARRDFLNADFYQALADALNQAVLTNVTEQPAACLDAGCGEGYYLRQLAKAAQTQGKSLSLLGLDVSKWAVLSAAKQDQTTKHTRWVVGTNAKLPVPDASLDHILCLFGFPVYGEFLRALKPDGQLWLAEAGEQHLHQLKTIIYPSIKTTAPKPLTTPNGFRLLESKRIQFDLHLPQPSDIANLLAMTPHQHRATQAGKDALAALTDLSVSTDVWLHQLEKIKE